jgi:WD40 repeat protein
VFTSAGAVNKFRIEEPSTIRVLTAHQAPVGNLAWSRNNRTLATVNTRFQISIWDAISSSLVDHFSCEINDAYWPENGGVSVSDDGKKVGFAIGGENETRIILWDVTGKKFIANQVVKESGHHRIASMHDDSFVIVSEVREEGKNNRQSIVRELRNTQLGHPRILRKSRPVDERGFQNHILSADGRVFAWLGPRNPKEEQRSEVFEVARGRVLLDELCPGGSLLLSIDGRFLWTTTSNDEQSIRFDLSKTPPVTNRDSPSLPRTMSPDYQWRIDQDREGEFSLSRKGSKAPLIVFAKDVWTRSDIRSSFQFSPESDRLAWTTQTGALGLINLPDLEKQIAWLFDKMEE